MGKPATTGNWCAILELNHCGHKILTLPTALAMAAAGADSGWYVAPFALVWTVGRAADDNEKYHITRDDGEPISFPTREEAASFVDSLCALAAAWATQELAPESLPPGLELARKWGVDLLGRVWPHLPSLVQCYTCAARPMCIAAGLPSNVAGAYSSRYAATCA
jgi:hypothetical protein